LAGLTQKIQKEFNRRVISSAAAQIELAPAATEEQAPLSPIACCSMPTIVHLLHCSSVFPYPHEQGLSEAVPLAKKRMKRSRAQTLVRLNLFARKPAILSKRIAGTTSVYKIQASSC
jgi:hypothetical protein